MKAVLLLLWLQLLVLPVSASVDNAADAALKAKGNRYVAVVNDLSGQLVASQQRYFQWCDLQSGPTGREPEVKGLFRIHRLEELIGRLRENRRAAPALAIDAGVEAYADAAEAAALLINRAENYYRKEAYREDAFAHGRVLHGQLMAAFTRFNQAHDSFVTAYQAMRAAHKQLQIARLESSGRRLLVLVERAQIHADAIDTYVRSEQERLDGNFREMQTQTLSDFASHLEPLLDDLRRHVETNPDEVVKEFGDTGGKSAGSYINALDALLKSAQVMIGKVNSGEEYSKLLSPVMINGTPQNLASRYNAVAEIYNGMVR